MDTTESIWMAALMGCAVFIVVFLFLTQVWGQGGRTEVHVWCDTKGATINYKVSKDKKLTTVWCLKNGKRVP